MDEFGESASVYVWPKDHVDGTAYPADFWLRVGAALEAAGFEWEVC